MRARMKDIAREANVSVTTVSRVIHDSGYVAEGTKQKILQAIKKNSYSLDGIAQSLRTRRTSTLGFIMTQIYPDPFQSTVAMYLESEARKVGYRVIIHNTLGKEEEEEYAVNLFIKERVDGIVFAYLTNPANARILRTNKMPYVLVERNRNITSASAVLFDYGRGVQMAMDHLQAKGARRIGLIGAKPGDPVEDAIFTNYRTWLARNGLPFDESLTAFGWMDAETGYQGIRKFWEQGSLPGACVIVNDITAMGALQALLDLGVKVPEDMMIVACDDTLSKFTAPPLSSISFNKEATSKAALELIMKRIHQANASPEVMVIQPELVKRKSTGD